jgi:hypothetical protein
MDETAEEYSIEDYIAAANSYYANIGAVLPEWPQLCPVCGEDEPAGAEAGPAHRRADNGVLLVGCEGYRVQDPAMFGIADPSWHMLLPLVGLIEIARRAGVRRNTINSWRDRHPEFPRPVAELKIGPVF